jgi:archaellin
MKCPKCDSENADSAKFCKKCGTPLKNNSISHENMINSMNQSDNSTTKIIIVALIIVAIVLAGALIYIYGFGNTQSDETIFQQENQQQNITVDDIENSDDAQEDEVVQASQPVQSSPKSQMKILGGSFETGSELSDLTYASIYVGPEHAGEDVTIQIYYSRDGNALNNGNMVPNTVDSSGYIDVKSADAYRYYPDYATVNLYDSSGNLMDTQSVSLSPTSGTQTF